MRPFTHAKAAFRRGFNLPDARDVTKLTSRVHPIVYSAAADRIGRLGHPLAEWVVTFYANVKDIEFAGENNRARHDTKRGVAAGSGWHR